MTPALLTDTVTPDLDRALHYAGLWGVEAVELRTVGGAGERVPFVNEKKLRRRLEEMEFDVAAIVPGVFEGAATDRVARLNEVVALRETLDFAARIGCPLVVVSAFAADDFDAEKAVDVLRRAGDAAARAGRTLAVLNEIDSAHPTGAALATLLERADHPHVRAAWSPADALQNGENVADGLAALGSRVSLVRYRDGQGMGEAWEEAIPGEGQIDWAAQLAALRKQGFDGPVSLDVRVLPKPKTGVRAVASLIAALRAARRNG